MLHKKLKSGLLNSSSFSSMLHLINQNYMFITYSISSLNIGFIVAQRIRLLAPQPALVVEHGHRAHGHHLRRAGHGHVHQPQQSAPRHARRRARGGGHHEERRGRAGDGRHRQHEQRRLRGLHRRKLPRVAERARGAVAPGLFVRIAIFFSQQYRFSYRNR